MPDSQNPPHQTPSPTRLLPTAAAVAVPAGLIATGCATIGVDRTALLTGLLAGIGLAMTGVADYLVQQHADDVAHRIAHLDVAELAAAFGNDSPAV